MEAYNSFKIEYNELKGRHNAYVCEEELISQHRFPVTYKQIRYDSFRTGGIS